MATIASKSPTNIAGQEVTQLPMSFVSMSKIANVLFWAILLKNSALNRSNSDSLVFAASEEIGDDGTVGRERCQAVL